MSVTLRRVMTDDYEWGTEYTYVLADPTAEQSAELTAVLDRVGARRRAKQIHRHVIEHSIGLEGVDVPVVLAEPMLCGGPTLYGTGSWFVITDTHIWAVTNNGRDGDDWSRNNVWTGGAGAVGHRVPLEEALAGEIRGLHEKGVVL
ncbi:hypothetical protein [Arsenicicoccus sp. UBA7492]|uniref:hypothetical protein n=1 Tax=Arsenicicoccus sp. UBA7492 TaxID=1946057 RepID=UPI002580D4DB|nr:hypothetical protein [Arsenicicoccus sp. UBA7492]